MLSEIAADSAVIELADAAGVDLDELEAELGAFLEEAGEEWEEWEEEIADWEVSDFEDSILAVIDYQVAGISLPLE